jgi:4-amino-4-deoxy-L-arabinose transferase-like glycosyltransferase
MATSTPQQLKAVQKDTPRHFIPIAMLAAFAIRLVVVYFTYRDLPDADKFYEAFGWEIGWVARALASGHGYSSPFFPWSGPTALVPPLYTALLAGIFRLFGIYSLTSGFVILSINSLLSALTCIPIYFSAKYSLGPRGAKIACWAWAVYPFAIYFSAARVWEYSLTTLLFTTCFCIAQRIQGTAKPLAWFGFGLLYGVTALSNPSVLSTLPFLLVLAIWKVGKSGRRWFLNSVLTAAGVLIVITPWTVRNYRAVHMLCPIRDNYWLEFYAGNFGDTSDPNPDSAHPASNPVEMKKFLAMGEAAYLADKHTMAVAYVSHYPAFFVYASLRRFFYYWSGFWSFSHQYMQREPFETPLMFFDICMALLMLRGVFRFWRENRVALLPYLVLIGFFPLTYYFSHPLMDYRQPIEPAIVVLAIAGAAPFKHMQSKNWIGAERANSSPDK